MTKLCFYVYHVHRVFNRGESSYGGAEINFYYLSREFAKRPNYQVTILVGDEGQADEEEVDQVRLKKIKYYNDRRNTIWYSLLKRWSITREFLTNDADIFIISTALAGNIMFYCLLFAKWLRGKKIIYRVASDRDVDGFYQQEKTIISKQYRFSLRQVDRIVVQNRSQQVMLAENEGLDSVIIKNGFPLSPLERTEKKYHLWVGRAIEIKRPEIFLEIAAQIPDQQFVMIIPGKGKVKQMVLKLSESLQNVTVIDQVNFFEINQYFAEARCFVNTSDFEGFPNTFIQSFMNYTPVCSLNVNPDNIINEHHLGKFCEGSVPEAVSYLRSLTEDKLLEIGSSVFQYITRYHQLSDKANQYEELFLQLQHKDQ